MPDYGELKDLLRSRYENLWTEQSSWRAHWQEISENMQPRRARFYEKDANKGDKRNQKIINNTPLIAGRTASAGIMASMSSPARQWWRLAHPDPDVMKRAGVKAWLFRRQTLMTSIIAKSNLYNALAGAVYPDLLYFGTHASFLEEDTEKIIRIYPQAIGEYVLDTNEFGEVDTIGRDIPMTVRQLVRKFGIENVSENVRDMYQKSNYSTMIRVIHFVCPNEDYDQFSPFSKKYLSVWFEKGDSKKGRFLRVAGYSRFPVIGPRWALTNSVSDVYGFSPAMDVLGDAKELQHLEKQKARLSDKLADPTLAVPEEMKNSRITLIPGQHIYVPRSASGLRIEPVQQIAPQGPAVLGELISQVERRINDGFFASLWLMMNQDDRTQPATAREIAELHEEKMLQLGPVVERFEDELLNPTLDFVFDRVDDLGLQEDPPEELAGETLKIEYISVMAQAQRLVTAASTEKFVSFTLGLAQAKPEVLDKLNSDAIVESMAVTMGVDPDFVMDQKQVESIRSKRAEAEQAAQQGEAMVQGAKGLKDASQTDTEKLQELARMMGGPAGASAAGFMPPGGLPMQ